MSFQDRRAELLDTHRAIEAAGLPYVLVGGWAVSAFQTRFTTDVDMVIPRSALAEYDELLVDLGFHRTSVTDVSNVYEGRIVQYEKPVGAHSVAFDSLVGALRCRQTDAEWSFRYLSAHSTVCSLTVAEDVSARIPDPALLLAMKVHSGRIADTRDVVVISREADLQTVDQHIHRGDEGALAGQIEGVLARLDEDGFADSFKGVFEQQSLPDAAIEEVQSYLEAVRDSL